MTTVIYQQTFFGLPVWEAGLSIHLKREPFQVVSAQSTAHRQLAVKKPTTDALNHLKKMEPAELMRLLGLSSELEAYDIALFEVQYQHLVIYRFDSANRILKPEKSPVSASEHEVEIMPEKEGRLLTFASEHPNLPLPPVAKDIKDGQHYVAAEIHFVLGTRRFPDLHWVTVLEAETLSVLYLRAYVDSVCGLVFVNEPMTDNGGPMPNANDATLNPVRTSVPLEGLNAPSGGIQSLSGSLVRLDDLELPTVPPPTEPDGTDFNFNARTNDFAAVNAYYHCDRFFRLLEDLGFGLGTYMSGTTFPTPVDHRGCMYSEDGIEVNAHCLGTSSGILRTTFALADLSDTANPLGIACDYRVVLHELGGHGILYNCVNSPNFGFAHSAGDSFAAILCDPESHAYNNTNPNDPNRFYTFPWVNIGRRHDRSVFAGWGWGGSYDVGGYYSEQILSTTHFRIYRSIGGDSDQRSMRQLAARIMAYLMLRTIGSFSKVTNPSNVSNYATALITADVGEWTSEGLSGGAYGKVIRWAFEQQGLYQPAGSPIPVTTIGAPPPVDVYIDDGRHGEYQFQSNHWSCQSIWNRRANDGGLSHEEPIVGATNYAYVKIKNRGTQIAKKVIVKGYHCNPGAGLVWPNDWQPMSTAQLSASNIAPNNSAEITVGPFEWIPSQLGHECMLMIVSAAGDPSNVDNFKKGDSIPEWRLVPHDNNIGQRNVYPVAGGGGLNGLLASAASLKFKIKNPHPKRAIMINQVTLPKFLVEHGWNLEFTNPGGHAFPLNAGESQEITLRFKPGKDFTSEEVQHEKNPYILVETFADGILIGGMSYQIDPWLKEPFNQTPSVANVNDCRDIARQLIDCLDLPSKEIKSIKIKRITIDIDFKEDC